MPHISQQRDAVVKIETVTLSLCSLINEFYFKTKALILFFFFQISNFEALSLSLHL